MPATSSDFSRSELDQKKKDVKHKMPCTLRGDIHPDDMQNCINPNVCTPNTNQSDCGRWLDDLEYLECCIWTEGLK